MHSLKARLAPLLVLAAVLTIPYVQHTWKLHSVAATAHAAELRPAVHQEVSGQPVRIVVPSAAIDLPVVHGTQNKTTQVWSVSPSAANYAATTAQPNNQGGQTLIYAHATDNLFGPLLSLRPGAEALVYTANRHVLTYRYRESRDVTPHQTGIFADLKHGTGLVLMTCDGSVSQYRRLLAFNLVQAS